MIVKELIKVLQQLDQEKEVWCTESASGEPEMQKVGSVELEKDMLTIGEGRQIVRKEVYVIYGADI